MDSDFPSSPRLLEDGVVVYETNAPVATNVIVFHYDQVSRKQGAAGGKRQRRRGETFRLADAPKALLGAQHVRGRADRCSANHRATMHCRSSPVRLARCESDDHERT